MWGHAHVTPRTHHHGGLPQFLFLFSFFILFFIFCGDRSILRASLEKARGREERPRREENGGRGRSRRMKEDLFETRPKSRFAGTGTYFHRGSRCSGRVAILRVPCPPFVSSTLPAEPKRRRGRREKRFLFPPFFLLFFLFPPLLKIPLVFPGEAEARRRVFCALLRARGGSGGKRLNR